MRVRELSVLIVSAAIAFSAASTLAQKPESFEQAQTLSTQAEMPILLEFFRDG